MSDPRSPRRWLRLPGRRTQVLAFLAVLGPGVITASADNDAQGITTYSITGAKTGFALLWLLFLMLFSLSVTQEMGARLGMATGKGLGALIRERYGVRSAAIAMALLVVANLGTSAAEFAGIAAALEIFGVSKFISVPIAALVVFLLVSRGSYKRVERVFLVLSSFYIAYVISVFLAHPHWGEAFHHMVVPHMEWTSAFVLTAVALVGTTVTPWGQFFIQAYVVDKGLTTEDLQLERADVFVGQFSAIAIAFFIIVATAATIWARGLTITDAKDAALALEPLAGKLATLLFGLGLFNAGFLAAGILPLSTAYAVCEAFGFELGVDERVRDAPVFYGVFGFAIVFGAVLVLVVGPHQLVPILYISSAVNAVLLAPILIYLYRLCNDKELLGDHANGKLANVLSGGTIVILITLTVVLLYFTLHPSA
jgi:NRAMP (natural resistance-associated macrophage protein)-like metal ion transporter